MKGFFTSGYLVEDRERAPVDTLKVITPEHKSRPSTVARVRYMMYAASVALLRPQLASKLRHSSCFVRMLPSQHALLDLDQ